MQFERLLSAILAALFVTAGCGDATKPSATAGDAASSSTSSPSETGTPSEAKDAAADAAARKQQGLEAGIEAVAYGLPLVLMDITRQATTNVAKPEGFAAPINQFVHLRTFPDASFKAVVRANVDTLYSSAWLDLGAEPIVLTVPDTQGRYFLLPMLDAWTNVFASPGKRTTGTKAGLFVITGPNFQGELPADLERIESPTDLVWIIGRTQTDGPADYQAVHAIQDGYGLMPLSALGRAYAPPLATVDPAIDTKTPPVEQLKRMSSEQFLDRLALLMKTNPPPAADAAALARLAKLGVVPGEKFDATKLDPAFGKGLARALAAAIAKLEAASKETGAPVAGWRIPPMVLGRYGTDYGARAVIALVGLGANLPQDAVYPSAYVDVDGQALSGAKRYVLRFEPGAEPPVDAFWSVTLYDPQSFFVPNPIGRQAVSSWMPFQRKPDGALELLIQHDSPGKDAESNWLPAPEGEFNVTLRMYWPKSTPPSILDGSWKPPGIRVVPSR
jgi:hypothetical protein